MIRGINERGYIVLGLTRRELEGLLEGKVCCYPAGKPTPDSVHICIYFGETNADAQHAMSKSFEQMPVPIDYRTQKASEDN